MNFDFVYHWSDMLNPKRKIFLILVKLKEFKTQLNTFVFTKVQFRY
jgi:hypothetical protein